MCTIENECVDNHRQIWNEKSQSDDDKLKITNSIEALPNEFILCLFFHSLCTYLASTHVTLMLVCICSPSFFSFFILLSKLKNNNRPKCQTMFNCYYRFIWGSATTPYMICLPACLLAIYVCVQCWIEVTNKFTDFMIFRSFAYWQFCNMATFHWKSANFYVCISCYQSSSYVCNISVLCLVFICIFIEWCSFVYVLCFVLLFSFVYDGFNNFMICIFGPLSRLSHLLISNKNRTTDTCIHSTE